MFKSGPRLSYANVAATLALVFSMSGGALAASHYLINSTSQINPRVIGALKGHIGAAGPSGASGPAGPAGPSGPEGKQGKEGLQGKEGKQGSQGQEGPQGKEGAAGSALAYAHVVNGAIVAGESRNMGGLTPLAEEGGVSVYCFTGLGFTPHNVTATLDMSEGGSPATNEPRPLATIRSTLGASLSCPSSTQVTVEVSEESLEPASEHKKTRKAKGKGKGKGGKEKETEVVTHYEVVPKKTAGSPGFFLQIN